LLLSRQQGAVVLLTSGPWTTPLVVPAAAGQITRGIRFAPGSAPGLLGAEASQLVNRVAPLTPSCVLPLPELTSALQLPTMDETAAQLDTMLLKLVDGLPTPDPIIAGAILLLWGSGGTIPLPAVAAQMGCSPRTLLRRVRQATGLTPKQFARIVRFHTAARAIASGGATISTAAASGGYADQPHFHHEVGSLTGLTPGELTARIRSTEHRQG
jgi:AraC-like DNA-binding protein